LTKKNIPTTADDLASPGDFFNQVRKIEITKSKCFRPEGFHIYQIQPSSLYPGWPRFSADVPRRIPVGLVKDEKEGRIYICQNPPCQVPANPEKHS
jgi:hypothetical protein